MSDQPDPVDYYVCLDQYSEPVSFYSSLSDNLLNVFPSDESIMEVMSLHERPWEDYHHQ